MALGSLQDKSSRQPAPEINVVPLVDVMLVLLVIFIITAPLLTNAIKIDLPKAASAPNITAPEHIEFSVRQDGGLYWNGEPVEFSALEQRFAQAAALTPQPELHIHADRLAYYENVARVMAIAGKAGIIRIGFITDPSAAR